MRVSIIAAMGENREIGINGKLPWHLPDETKFFRKITLGRHVVMGRKTFESIGQPLSLRRNIVVSGTLENFTTGISVAKTLTEAIELARSRYEEEVFVIGGEKTYNEAVLIADRMYLTTVMAKFPNADTFFPEFEQMEWLMLGSDVHKKDIQHEYKFITRVFNRRK